MHSVVFYGQAFRDYFGPLAFHLPPPACHLHRNGSSVSHSNERESPNLVFFTEVFLCSVFVSLIASEVHL